MPDKAPLPPISRQHLEVMTDGVGIMQHAIGSWPDPAHGYRVDDVARALQLDLLHGRTLRWAAVEQSAWRGLRFLDDAFDEVVREVTRRYDPLTGLETQSISPVSDVFGMELVRSWREGVWRNAERLVNAGSAEEREQVAETIKLQASATAGMIATKSSRKQNRRVSGGRSIGRH